MVKLELYRVFREVAEAGNISLAAENLYLSQSAVSQSDLSNVISLADDGCAHAAHDSSDRSHLDLLFIL